MVLPTRTWIHCQSTATRDSSPTTSSIKRIWTRTRATRTEQAKTTRIRARRHRWWAAWAKTTWCRIITRDKWASSSKWTRTPDSTAILCHRTVSNIEWKIEWSICIKHSWLFNKWNSPTASLWQAQTTHKWWHHMMPHYTIHIYTDHICCTYRWPSRVNTNNHYKL